MKNIKKIAALSMAAALTLGCAACGGSSEGDSSTGSTTIRASFESLEKLGAGFNAAYYPDAASVKQYSGTIDVVLDFDTNVWGWKAVAAEYERLQSGAVSVKIDTNYSGSTYNERLNQELSDYTRTEWDLIEGNLGGGATNKACVSVKSFSTENNPYCGKDVRWTTVLEDNAFKNVESGSDDSYIVNSEDMQTCWFVNRVALDAAAEKGYVNANGEASYPVTWDDMILLCEKMEEAGYTNPLGISLSEASIQTAQFSWLLRIYGDYYYRQYYQYIMASDEWEHYDPTDAYVEQAIGYGVKFNKIANIMLDTTTTDGPGYVGAESDVYADFLSQFAKMKGHLMRNTASTEFNDARDQFRVQSDKKSSPQIFLDYLGNGVIFQESENDDFQLGYFDYPQMVSKYVDEDTLTRDIGGNGGFISVIKHIGDSNQNALNIDFLKFYLSPYGQTFYYRGLAEHNVAPKGTSTVKNDLFTISETWTNFYQEAEKTVKFNGNVDGNLFLSWGVRYFSGFQNTTGYTTEGWRGLLMENLGSSSKTIDQFASEWSAACMKDYKLKCKESQWSEDMYLNFNGKVN